MKDWRFIIFLLVALFSLSLAAGFGPAKFKLTFFAIGQGDAALIQTPAGQIILIDGGPSRDILDKLGRALPWTKHTIDLVILSHPHADHLVGLLTVLENYHVRQILATGVIHTTSEYLEFLRLIKDKKIPLLIAQANQVINLAGDVEVRVLYPSSPYAGAVVKDLNITSVVNLVRYGNTKVLFTGDTPVENEKWLIERDVDLSAQIIKIAHQGSDSSTSREFLLAVKPDHAVISVGAKNRYGHPSAEVMARLQSLGIAIWRTDEMGDIEFTSDGQLWYPTNANP